MEKEHHPRNPFALLRIPTQLTRQEIMEHIRELAETEDEEGIIPYRNAYEQIRHPFDRLVLTVWEMPDTDYVDHDEAWRKFARAFRSNPTDSNELRQLADTFVDDNFHPNQLLELLSPLLTVTRPTQKRPFSLGPPASDDIHYPLSAKDLF